MLSDSKLNASGLQKACFGVCAALLHNLCRYAATIVLACCASLELVISDAFILRLYYAINM